MQSVKSLLHTNKTILYVTPKPFILKRNVKKRVNLNMVHHTQLNAVVKRVMELTILCILAAVFTKA